MKKLLFLLLPTLSCLYGCINTTEEILVQQNGSGVYGVTIDMSGMFDMIKSMAEGQMSDKAAKELQQEQDTIIRFSSFTDTASKLTADEKALLRDATIHMVMSEKEKKFLMEMKYPFKKATDVERILKLVEKNGNVLGKVLGGPEENHEMQGAAPDLNSYYDLNFRDGLLEKKVNAAKLKAFQENPQYEQLKGASGMMGDATISSVIKLPRAAKKVEGANAKASDGGKTITIAAPMADAIENPNALTFRIEY